MCVDVDNGPDWTVTEDNDRLYGTIGTELLHRRLALEVARPAEATVREGV